MKPAYEINDMFQLADSYVNNTLCHVFLTGKAGSGKTTFLHHIKHHAAKKSVVVAPTGVAAINAGGMTIHSFFQIPIGTYMPDPSSLLEIKNFPRAVHTRPELLKKLRMNSQKKKLIRELELLIIDEVSMVRADLMDAMDAVLRYVRKNPNQPFGGLQVLMIGDLYQLPPVVPEDEKQLMAGSYKTPYFFSARVMDTVSLVKLELDKIYRQQDEKFLDILNRIRENLLDDSGLEYLNSFYNPGFKPPENQNYITLCSHHYKANAINDRELEKLPGKSTRFEAEIDGDFNESATPADQSLLLKEGAQVMFVKNDKSEHKRYYNGKIGVIDDIDGDNITVSFPGEDGKLSLEKEEWMNIRYSLDEKSKMISEKILGTFRQYPIRLAWAITIHKSQGLTFDRAIIDAGDSFASGQVYVALSRLRSLDGLVLLTLLQKNSIRVDGHILELDHFPDQDELIVQLDKEQKIYMESLIHKSMDWNKFMDSFMDFIHEYRKKNVTYAEEAVSIGQYCLKRGQELQKIAKKFDSSISKLMKTGKEAFPKLSGRMEDARAYFDKKLAEEFEEPLNSHYQQMKKKPRMKKYLTALTGLKKSVAIKKEEIDQACQLAEGLAGGEDSSRLLDSIKEQKKKSEKLPSPEIKSHTPQKGDSRKLSFEMYQSGKSIEEIASERSLTTGTIESHLLHYLKEGVLDVYDFVTEDEYETISRELKKRTWDSLSEVKYLLDDNYSYNEIKAVLYHLQATYKP